MGEAMKRKTLSEHDTQRQILDWLELKHIFHYRNNTGSIKIGNRFVRFGIPGAPDIVAVVDGLFVGIEVKRLGEGQSDKQIAFERDIRAAGAEYILAYDLEDVRRDLEY